VADTLDIPAAGSPEAVAALEDGLRHLQDALRCPGLEDALADGELPDALVTALEGWWAAYERYLALVGDSLPLTCRAGCNHCCRHNPRGVSGVEVLWAVRAARAHPDGAAMLSEMAGLAVRFDAHAQATGSAAKASAAAGLRGDPCGFLGADGRCRVYGSRPAVCRMFVAVTEPAWCDHTHPRHGEARNPHLVPPLILRQLLLAISQRLGLSGLPRDLWRGVAAYDAQHPVP
jgi:Fe-S-cluster containining protein